MSSRYAVTVITSRVANRMEESKEIEFHVRIPKNAFISKFKMYVRLRCINTTILEDSGTHSAFLGMIDINIVFLLLRVIDGQEYDGIVKEKEKAQQQYSQAVSQGQSAGIVRYHNHLFQLLVDHTFLLERWRKTIRVGSFLQFSGEDT